MSQNTQKQSLSKALILVFLFSALLPNSFIISSPNPTQTQSASQSPGTAKSAAKPASSSSSSAMKKKKRKKQVAKKRAPRGQREIEPSRVLEIQNALAAAGYYKEQPSGQWDTSTAQAMSAYQESNGFKVTGKPNALSLKKLGL